MDIFNVLGQNNNAQSNAVNREVVDIQTLCVFKKAFHDLRMKTK
jgi:hypothetical protein